jgi:outer membrane protein with beta-barrel domain
MKRIFTLCIILCAFISGFAQVDTTANPKKPEGDTIRIGGMIIIRKPGSKDRNDEYHKEYTIRNRRGDKPSNVSTNALILDLGFSNYIDNSNYTTAVSSGFVTPAVGKDQLKLKTGKSRNVNLWFFMQKLNLIKRVVNLKYGLGIELNNYHFEDNIVLSKNPTQVSLSPDEFKKRKLAADYLTVPLMINFNFTPDRRRGYGFSAGVSAGYLYSARYKTKDGGKIDKVKDDFNLERFKLSYIGEISLGKLKLYGSYAFDNMWEKGLDMTPFNFGFRLGYW